MDYSGGRPELLHEPYYSEMESSFVSAYSVMAVALVCAIVVGRDFGRHTTKLKRMSTQFILFGLLTGLAFGFGATAHHALAISLQDGHGASMRWGDANARWLLLWMAAMFFYPSSNAFLAGVAMSLTHQGCQMRRVQVLGVIVGFVELLVLFARVEFTGVVALVWGASMSVLAIIVVAIAPSVVGSCRMVSGAFFNLVGQLLLIFIPKACWETDGDWEADREVAARRCVVPLDFNHRTVFNILSMVSVLFVYTAAMAKLREDHPPQPP